MIRRYFLKYLFIYLTILLTGPRRVLSTQLKIPAIGQKAPNFNLNGYNKNKPDKEKWSLDDFKGQWLILYFYPKDFTSGCTIEARGFQSMLTKYKQLNAEIVGISADSAIEHKSFCNSEKLGYTLLSDKMNETSKKYGSWSDPYSSRNTFLINTNGEISYRWIGVSPTRHANHVLEKLIELQN